MKKDFNKNINSNPANTYISGGSNDEKTETKSKRLNLLVYPTLLNDLKKIALMNRKSVNELLNEVLREYTEGETETIEKYNEVFGNEI